MNLCTAFRLTCKDPLQVGIVFAETLLKPLEFGDFPTRVNDCCVVSSAKSVSDFREAVIRQLFR